MSIAEMKEKDIVEKLRETLRTEAGSIERAAARLDSASAENAIALLMQCSGKVIVTGVGKSGVIARKIAQTMTSVGTPAIYLDAVEAMHGSLGIISGDDIMIAISNSGETAELVAMLPALKARNVPVISILGNLRSTIAEASAVVLDGSVDREACPLNLAPTASTTVALALGDALAMTLMELKGLTDDDFAANHPAGRLGKRLTLFVSDIMSPTSDVARDCDLLGVAKAISDGGLGAVNVVDSDGRLVGIVTDGDLRRMIERTSPEKFSSIDAASMMTASPVTVTGDILAYDALRIMEDRPSQISVLPVIDGTTKPIGMLRLHDILKVGI